MRLRVLILAFLFVGLLFMSPLVTASTSVLAASTTSTSASGPDRLSIPDLGIDAPIWTTACDSPIPDGIWYWPCAGNNNLYLAGHNWGAFRPLQVAYHDGRLTQGMVALLWDQDAVVHRYRLLWVEVLPLPTFGQGAVWAETPGPVITLQTCDGPTNEYRLVVRFVAA